MTQQPTIQKRHVVASNGGLQLGLRPFFAWIATFLAVWLGIMTYCDLWSAVANRWPVSLAMAFGSYVAGSTPMGGGTVGFPVLVLLFDFPGSDGKTFGLAIQSIGMVSASIFLFCSGTRMDWAFLKSAFLGMFIGLPLAALFIQPLVSDLAVKMLFAVLWASFGLLHLAKTREFLSYRNVDRQIQGHSQRIALVIGLLGGITSALTGVGIDMLAYVVLTLLFRADLKISIPTSVVLMAATSVTGVVVYQFLSFAMPSEYGVSDEIFLCWLAAAPVVLFGAPLGSFAVSLLPRQVTLVFVSLLCIAQYIWMLFDQRPPIAMTIASLVAIGALNALFYALYLVGRGINAVRP